MTDPDEYNRIDLNEVIEALRQQVKALQRSSLDTCKLKDAAERELAALKQQGEPVAWEVFWPGISEPTVARVEPKIGYTTKRPLSYIYTYTSATTIPQWWVAQAIKLARDTLASDELEDGTMEMNNALGQLVIDAGELLAALRQQGEPEVWKLTSASGKTVNWCEEDPRPNNMEMGGTVVAYCRYTSAPSIPEGWQLVPVEPTDEMVEAAEVAFEGGSEGIWDAMLAVAPKGEKE